MQPLPIQTMGPVMQTPMGLVMMKEPPRTPQSSPPCPHKDINDHKRLRMKNGLVHLVCLRCGVKWKKASKSHVAMADGTSLVSLGGQGMSNDELQAHVSRLLMLSNVPIKPQGTPGSSLSASAPPFHSSGGLEKDVVHSISVGVPPVTLDAAAAEGVPAWQPPAMQSHLRNLQAPPRLNKDWPLGLAISVGAPPVISQETAWNETMAALQRGYDETEDNEEEGEAQFITDACSPQVQLADNSEWPGFAEEDALLQALLAEEVSGGLLNSSVFSSLVALHNKGNHNMGSNGATTNPAQSNLQASPHVPLSTVSTVELQTQPDNSAMWTGLLGLPNDPQQSCVGSPLPIVYVPPLSPYGPLLRCPNIANPYHWCSHFCHEKWGRHERPPTVRPPRYASRFGDGADVPKSGVQPILPPGFAPSCSSVEGSLQNLESFIDVSAVLHAATQRNWELQSALPETAPAPHVVTAIHAYTQEGPLYTLLHQAIRENDETLLPLCRDYLYFLTLALLRMPVVNTGCVYRALRSRVASKAYQPGNVVTWQPLTSAALYPSVLLGACFGGASQPRGTVFVINVAHARSIRLCSANPNEEEVILPPNSHFQVLSVAATHAAKAALLPDLAPYDLGDLIVYELRQVVPALHPKLHSGKSE
eukprot:TRINITY_DN14386_c0_g1_i1.p1 TRINITY_DN14386_c0_g1~~TRINITY_DN14386_c0_g1_i1.p1  ORF type:complete len:647 (-),score=61.62 TRINITY_DN14386_c0_g1_i1:793-2733(-)